VSAASARPSSGPRVALPYTRSRPTLER